MLAVPKFHAKYSEYPEHGPVNATGRGRTVRRHQQCAGRLQGPEDQVKQAPRRG